MMLIDESAGSTGINGGDGVISKPLEHHTALSYHDEGNCRSKSRSDTLSSATSMDEIDTEIPIRKKKSVRFSTINIRKYNRVCGDNPGVIGPPLALGWNYYQTEPIEINSYEENRLRKGEESNILLTPNDRKQLLISEWGYTLIELCHYDRESASKREGQVNIQKIHKKTSRFRNMKKKLNSVLQLASSGFSVMGGVVNPITTSTGDFHGVMFHGGM